VKLLPLRRPFAVPAFDAGRARLAFFALVAGLVLLTAVKYTIKISKPGDTGQQTRSAFLRWREMVNGVFAGANVYVGKHEYPNPPIMAIVLRPFTALPPTVGALAWFATKVLLAVLACLWVFRLCAQRQPTPPASLPEGRGEEEPARADELDGAPLSDSPLPSGSGARGVGALNLARGVAVLLCLPSLLGDLSHNNVNIFILFLVVGCLEAFRKRLDVLAGLVLALAVACKVTPLLFVAYFGWKRCWRVLAATGVGLALWLVIVPGLTFGWDRNRELMGDWYALMVERPLLKGEATTEHPNQALPGFVYRLFTHSPSYIEYAKTSEGDIPVPGAYHNLTDIGRPAAWAVVKALTALFALAVVVLCRTRVRGPTDPRTGWRFAAECGFICLGMLLLSERTWKHHAVILLLPLAALTYALATANLPRRVWNFACGALVACLVLTAAPGFLSGRGQDLALVYGTYTLAFVLLAGAVGLLLACRSDDVGGLERAGARPNPVC